MHHLCINLKSPQTKSFAGPAWSAWGDFSACSTDCGPGTHTAKRTCSHPGKCEGQDSKTETCTLGACKFDILS